MINVDERNRDINEAGDRLKDLGAGEYGSYARELVLNVHKYTIRNIIDEKSCESTYSGYC